MLLIAEVYQSVEIGDGLKNNTAAAAAVAAVRSAEFQILFVAEREGSVTAVPGFQVNFGTKEIFSIYADSM